MAFSPTAGGGGQNPAFMQQVMQVHQSASQTTPSPNNPQQAPPPPPMGQAQPPQPGAQIGGQQFRMNASPPPPPLPLQQQQQQAPPQKPLQMPSFQPQQQQQQQQPQQQGQVPWQAQAQMPAAAPGGEGAQNTGVVMGNMLEMMKMMSQGGGIAQQPNKPPMPPSFSGTNEPVNIGGAMSEMFSSMGQMQTNNQGGQRQTNFGQQSAYQAMGQTGARPQPQQQPQQQQQQTPNFNIQMNNGNAFMGGFSNPSNPASGNQQRGPQPGASSGFLTQPPQQGNNGGNQPQFPRPGTGSFSPTAGGGFAPPPASTAPRPGQGMNQQRGSSTNSKKSGGLLGSVLGSGKRA